MARRPPSSPPALTGFEYVRLLGSGGFADVFLYQQLHPRRQVAVKVLLLEKMGSTGADGFTEEANLMAQLATHPSIVSVYQAGVSGDGRPYLVMEYCSRPNLQVRHRREKFSEAETLRVGVQIAGAIETAHRAGILHRDIKPANVLVTDYGRPALTDFGISTTTSSEMAGMSIPWSPPEAFRSPPVGVPASDVYSLAATLYTLLTNRSPFEVAGASNSEIDVISRIQAQAMPPLGRADVSPALTAVLERAMAKDPAARYATAMDFGYALQRVQIELGMQATTIDVLEDEIDIAEEDDDDGRTRFRSITTIDAQPPERQPPPPEAQTLPGAMGSTSPAQDAPGPGLSDRTVSRSEVAPAETVRNARTPAPVPTLRPTPPVVPPLDDTYVPQRNVTAPSGDVGGRGRSRTLMWILAGAAALVAVGVAVALVVAPDGVAGPEETERAAAPVDAVDGADPVPQIEDLSGSAAGDEVTFTWTNPDPTEGDTYLWRPVVPGETFTFEESTSPTAVVATDRAGQACIEVVLRRANGTSAADGVEGGAP